MGHLLTPLPDGSTPLTETSQGQAMHSRLGAWREATEVYVTPSRIAESTGPVVLWDVGMGTAANAVAAIEGSACPLDIWSFENDLDGLRTAITHSHLFPWIGRHLGLLEQLLENRSVALPGGRGAWHLLEGDFRRTQHQATEPDLVFWDFYSPSVVPDLWNCDVFRILSGRLKPHALWLSYAAATPVRAALLLAGFYVSRGPSTAAKSETTQASLNPLSPKLGTEWLGKIDRSSRPLPYGYLGNRESLKQELLSSPNFS